MTSPTHGSPTLTPAQALATGVNEALADNCIVGSHRLTLTALLSAFDDAGASPPVGGATREPTDDSPNSLGPELAALRARDYRRINDPRSPVEAGAPGSAMQVHEQHEDRTEKSGLRPLSTASTDDARDAMTTPGPGERGYQGCPFCPLGVCLGREHHPSFAAGASEEADNEPCAPITYAEVVARGRAMHGVLNELDTLRARVSQLEATVAAARAFLVARDALDATSFGTTRQHHITAFDQALADLRGALTPHAAERP